MQGHVELLMAECPRDTPVTCASGTLSVSLSGRVQAEEK